MSQYFQLFKQPETFDLDTHALEKTYLVLTTQFHPDKFAAASAFEQKQAVMMSATINQAYNTLKDPIDRAAYLLKQQGIDADAPENTQLSPEFLMQQMEWRETLFDAQAQHNTAALQKLQQEIQTAQEKLFAQLQQSFATQQYDQAADQVRQGRFLNKIQHDLAVASN